MRIELEAKQDSEPYTLLPFDRHGFIVFYESIALSEDKDHTMWIYKMYDINMRQVWIQELPVINNLQLSGYVKNKDFIYLIYYNDEKSFEDNNFQIVRIPGKEGLVSAKTGKVPNKSVLTNFELFGSDLLLGLHSKDEKASLVLFTFDSAEQTQIDLDLSGMSFIMDVEVDSNASMVYITFKNYIENQSEQILVRTYNSEWNIINTVEIPNDESDYLINRCEYIKLSDDTALIVGTYKNNPNGKYKVTTNDVNFESNGFYIAKLAKNNSLFIVYHDFSEFQSFYKNLSVEDLSRIRKKEKDSEDITIDYNLLSHNTIVNDSIFVFVVEAYYPEYHTVTRMMYDWYGRPMPSYYHVFDGYRYTSAFVAGFDENGELLWDSGMELWNILTFNLEKRVNVIINSEETVLAFNNDGAISYKVLGDGEDLYGLDQVEIELSYSKDKIISETSSNMVFWYNNYFLTYGYQKIRNNAISSQSKRSVFYVNKIEFN